MALGDLGGDLQDLEERGLSRVATSGSRGHEHISGGHAADTGRGRHAVDLDHFADSAKIAVGEDEAHVAPVRPHLLIVYKSF